jgi:hypothetical protein
MIMMVLSCVGALVIASAFIGALVIASAFIGALVIASAFIGALVRASLALFQSRMRNRMSPLLTSNSGPLRNFLKSSKDSSRRSSKSKR